MSKNLVIVESPAKAHTIEKYLGADFQVLASVGHIRKDVKVDKSTFDVTYEIDPEHTKIISELKKAAKDADKIWLATDEDREGESISWHLLEVLKLPKDTARITFHEITKTALEEAVKNPRVVDMNMVSSQQARQTLDMLVGYDLSDIVRKKVPGAISAGRVQSPALRLIVEREKEIEKFESKPTFKVTADFGFAAALKDNLPDEKSATEFLESLKNANFIVDSIETTPGERKPQPPFTTASMQIEANAKLGFSSKTTMNAAQALYQAGLITYHRTDSLNLSKQALASIANYVEKTYGKNYLKVRNFKTKDTSAQEAHEAIRPTNINTITAGKNDYEKRLYNLIRNRTLATQMADAITEKTVVKITTPANQNALFEAKGEVVKFDGFLQVAGRSQDTELPALKQGQTLTAASITARETFAKPQARYTEGSLVKKLEELGIGRPSTYAGIISAIQTRGYVAKGESEGEEREVVELVLQVSSETFVSMNQNGYDHSGASETHNDGLERAREQKIQKKLVKEKFGANKGKLIPTPIGELVAGFLVDNFKDIVDYKFTANIEQDLDLVAEAKLERVKMLKDFYGPFKNTVLQAEGIERYNNAKLLGHDPKTGKPIYAKVGKHGGFIQLGDNEKETGEKPRFAPLPKRKTVKTVTLEQALKQLALPQLPRTLGKVSQNNQEVEIIASAGPFGPYLKAGKYNISLGKEDDPYLIDFARAKELYEQKMNSIIADFDDIKILIGTYGPYVKGPGRHNNVKIPEDIDPKTLTKADAEKLLAEKPKTKKSARHKSRKASKTKKSTTKTSKSTK